MKIAVNVRLLLSDKLEGIGWFTYETLKRITLNHPEHEFIFIFDREYSDEFIFSDNITPIVAFPPSRHPFLWWCFFEYSIPKILKKHKPDLFFSPDGFIPLRTDVPILNVIHDLNFEYNPKFIGPYFTRSYYKKYSPLFAEKSTRLATVSEFTKNDIISIYGIDPEKIDVVYNGSNENYVSIDDEVKKNVLQEFTQGNPYFIFIGAMHQRKNIASLFRAFDLFKSRNSNEIKLLMVGSKKWWKGEIEDTYLNLQWKKDVIFTGRLSPNILNKVLASSLALTYVSYFEGFGIPIIEAFNAETAVITSNTTSMPEVAMNAALFVDPYSVESIADAMQKISSDNDLRNSLIEKGRVRRNDFSWDRTAERLWESMEKTINFINSKKS